MKLLSKSELLGLAAKAESADKFTERDGILFMLAGDGHGAHLLTALYQLREVLKMDVRVAVVTTDEKAKDFVGRMSLENVENIHWQMDKEGRGKGGHYANKTRMLEITPFEGRTVFVDADTLIMSDRIGEMLPPDESSEVVNFTQFSDWITTGRTMQKRINKWKGIKGCELLSAMNSNPYPAINTGVFGFSKSSGTFFKEWNEVTLRNVSFMCDELSAQLIFPRFAHNIKPHNYNASVVFSKFDDLGEAVLWHGHGFKFIKNWRGRSIWMPKFIDAVRSNFGSCQDWLTTFKHSKKVMECVNSGKYLDNSESWNLQFESAMKGETYAA